MQNGERGAVRASRAIVGWVLGIHLAVLPMGSASGAAEPVSGSGEGTSAPAVRQVHATAYAVADGHVVFTVAIEETWDRGRLLATSETFRSPQGEPLARRTTEFARSGYQPASRSEALASGEKIDVRPVSDGIRIEHRREYGASPENAVLRPDEPVVVGSGLARFVRERWDRLMAGETLDFSIVVPRRLDWVRMRIRKEGEIEKDGRELVRFRLEPESFFVRTLVGGFEMQVDPESRALVTSIGSIEIPGGGDERVEARLVYEGALPGVAP
jgi:hypothetical protein